ncbi:DUF2335 domain-containing protein [Aureimonas altamirensis]|uniref:DUF2335 domain-containing protein n=1 Tax=Aureimonas altamirensis TaxID=370622 RepID=UPI001E354B18|nr:DUF2335 domain-containing protein [Aureimonas altamirensis]UHD44897.1 DUF2335 domain-containing protein [Aureimonas altamirensis]
MTTITTQEKYWAGPLPSPETLADFRELVPDAPERIFKQWEEEADHRRAYENRALDGLIKRDRRGQISAIVFAISALALSAWALYLGHPWISGIVGGGTIASVVGAFLYQRKSEQPPAQ